MVNPTPLLIVIGTIVSLAAIQWGLNRVENAPTRKKKQATPTASVPTTATTPPPTDKAATENATQTPKAASAPTAAAPVEKAAPKPKAKPKPKPIDKPLLPGLTVKGLDKRGQEQLKKLISEGNLLSLANWLAIHRPGIVELDDFLAKNRGLFQPLYANTFGANKEEKAREALVAFTVVDRPAGIRFNALSEQDRLTLLIFDPTSQRLINQDLIAQFGGQMFGECFDYYCRHDKGVARLVPTSASDRKILEMLANSSMADKGRHIPLASRLTVMSMEQLRQMARDLNREVQFTSQSDLANQLADIPGAAVLLSMQYTVDDLFILNPLKNEPENTIREWQFLKAYADLLISREVPTGLSS